MVSSSDLLSWLQVLEFCIWRALICFSASSSSSTSSSHRSLQLFETLSFFLPNIEAMDGNGLGFDRVMGKEPEIGVRVARGGPAFDGRRMARDFIDAPRDESRIDANEGVCCPTENQSL